MEPQNFSVPDFGNGSAFDLSANNDTYRHEPGLDMLVPIVGYSVMFVVGTAGNVTVFASLVRDKRRSRVTVLLTHLTTADLIVTFFMIPMEIMWRVTNEWRAGNVMCKVFMGIRAFGPYLSSNILVCISLDRFFVIVHPLRIGEAYRRGKTMLAIAWIFSFVCAFPQTIIFNVLQHPANPDFHQCVTFGSFSSEVQETLYNLFCIAAIYLVPLAVIIICYTCLIWKLWRKSRENEEDYNALGTERTASERVRLRKSDLTTITRAKSRTLKMTVTIVAAFIWCWTPYVVMTLWYMFDRNSAQNVDKQLQEMLFLMAVANSCVNPLVYGPYAMNRRTRGWCFGSENCCRSSPERRSTIKKSLLNPRLGRPRECGSTNKTCVVELVEKESSVSSTPSKEARPVSGFSPRPERVTAMACKLSPGGRRSSSCNSCDAEVVGVISAASSLPRYRAGQSSKSTRAMAGVLTAVLVLGLTQGAFNAPLPNFMQLLGFLFTDDAQICRTDACIDTAEELIASMDESIDPCEDFYEFACNGWIKNHPIPPTGISWSQFTALNEKQELRLRKILSEGPEEGDGPEIRAVKMVYEACMDEERVEGKGMQPLLDLLDDLNGWPLISPEITDGDIRWEETAVAVSRKVGMTPVLSVGVEVDLRNTSRNIITIEQPEQQTPAYFFFDPDYVREYGSYFLRVVRALRKTKPFPTSLLNINRRIRRIIKFEGALAILTKPKPEMKILDKLHNRVTIKHLQNWTDEAVSHSRTPPINWKAYIQNLLGKDESEINGDTQVVVSDMNFLRKFLRLIEVTHPETVVNYILWEVVKTLSRETNREMRRMEFEFKGQVVGVEQDIPRWQECVQTTNNLGFLTGYLYVKKYFSDEAKAKAINIVENIRREFRRELSEVTWIDEETKRAALEKADYMNHFIGYPNWYGNETGLGRYYEGLTVGRDHFANVVAVREFLVRKYLEKLDKSTSREEWIAGPALANAFYDPRMNSIIFPAGILESPFFNKDQPDALNYASIGSIIGHEITHAFDDVGRQGDKFGNINQWWAKETEEKYLQNAKCFVDNYSGFRFPRLENVTQTEMRLNGLRTLGENIADNGGLAISLRAYLRHYDGVPTVLPGLEKYSHEQLFYLGFARTWCETTSESSLFWDLMHGSHSPNSVRVRGSVSNSEHFAKTWGCAPGSKMNPVRKCRLW